MSRPISGLEHLRIGVADLDVAISDYRALLGTEPVRVKKNSDNTYALFAAGNVRVVLERSQGALGLTGACFRVPEIDSMRRRLDRLGFAVESATEIPTDEGAQVEGLALDPEAARGLSFTFVAHDPDEQAAPASGVTGLDHMVIATGDGDKTGFLLGAQLGLDLRMDLSNEAWDARLMFFRCGDLIVEVFQRLSEPTDPLSDHFYGLSWRVANADEARERLALEGFDVSEVRKGRKPGTRVLTVRNRTADVPTLLVEPPPPRG